MTTTPRLWKSLTQVNTTDAGVPPNGTAFQEVGEIGGLADGGYVVVWSDASRTYNPAGTAVVAQRYDSLGNKFGGEVKISQFSTGDQFSPAMTALPSGNVAIAYVDAIAGDQDIFVRIAGPGSGALSLGRIDVIDVGANLTFSPSISAFADGSYVITYTAGTGVDTDIVARIVSPTGTVGAQFDVENDTDNRNLSQVATLANGNFVVVYMDEFNDNANNTDIKFAIFAPTGGPPLVGPTFVPGGGGPALETKPDVAATRDGGFVVTWTDADSTNTDIRATVFDANGGNGNSNILVNTTTAGAQNDSNVVALANGDFVVTWEDDNTNLINAQRFDFLGSKVGTEFTVKAGVSFVTFDTPEATLLADGRIGYAVSDVSTGDADVMTAIWDPRTLQSNFDGINQTDFLFQNDSGQAAIWQLNGTSFSSGGAVGPNPGADWHLRGDGDFNKDGRSDLLWQNDNGQAALWLMNGTTLLAGGPVGPNPGADWHLIDSGDFNGDGNDDILWQNNSGQAAIWLMNGTSLAAAGAVGPNPGADWHIKASGDFNDDGKSDILWQQDGGQAAIWLMNGTTLLAGGTVGPNPGADWHVIDSGDFNPIIGDHRSDILWQSDSGQAAIWFVNGTSLLGGGAAGPNPGAGWHVKGTGEFNGDLRSDIVWQNNNGQAAVWLMNGTSLIAGGPAGPNPGADWDLIA